MTVTASAKPTVVEALSAVMEDVQAVGKTGRNTQQNYNFRGVDAVVNAVGPVLRKHGVVVVPVAAEVVEERYTTKTGTAMKGVTATITFRFYGPAGDWIDAQVCGESSDSGDKAVPKAHSVAYRTMLLQALCIPTDDPDPDADSHERGTQFVAPVADPHGLQASRADAPADGGEPALVRIHFGKNAGVTLGDLTPKQRQFYAESWAPNNPAYPVGPVERRLRQAARIMCGLPPVETEGPFAAASTQPAQEDDIPF